MLLHGLCSDRILHSNRNDDGIMDMNDLESWYWSQGHNGHLTTLERCVIVGVLIYSISEVIVWIKYLM